MLVTQQALPTTKRNQFCQEDITYEGFIGMSESWSS